MAWLPVCGHCERKLSAGLLKELIRHSHDLVYASLPGKTRAALR